VVTKRKAARRMVAVVMILVTLAYMMHSGWFLYCIRCQSRKRRKRRMDGWMEGEGGRGAL